MILLESLVVDGYKSLRRLELSFPTDGAVLVEGLNEAGKSTVFESIYFALYGSPLVTESPRGGPEEAIGYGRDTCAVTLVLSVGPTCLEVSRTVRRGRPTQATLVVSAPDREPETVQGVRPVNARIVEELGNLDGDALLNSCFVEQKKLSKLEDLTAERRRESLLRLLNLERLGEVEASLRQTRADDQELERARRRSELADLSAEIPRLRSELEKADQAALALSIRAGLADLAEQRAAMATAMHARFRAEARSAEVEALRHDLALLEAEREALRLEDELEQGVPALRAAERRLAAARESSARFQASDALVLWIRLRRSVDLRERGEEELRKAEAATALRLGEYQAARSAAERARAMTLALGATVAVALVAAVAGVSLALGWLSLGGLAAAAALGYLAWREYDAALSAANSAAVAESTLTEAKIQEQQIHGHRVAALHLGGSAEDLARCEATLSALGEQVPDDEEAARQRNAEIERRLVLLDRATVTSAERAAEMALEDLKQARSPLAARVDLHRDGRQPMDDAELASLAERVERGMRAFCLDDSLSDADRRAGLGDASARLLSQIGQERERENAAASRCRELESRVRSSLAVLGGSVGSSPPDLSTRPIEATLPLVAEVADVDAAELETRRSQLRGELFAAERQAERLTAELGIDGSLDPAECRAEVERLTRLAEVKRRAVDIVGEARKRMVARVLPNTERNFRLVLPRLTAGRYRDARIADDYRVEVWDEAAGRYVAKSIFSGGARDQFSLALRLAFALATLPEELGTSPGFLFLDEPLSSFDGQRTQALVDLLTRGEVAASFRQIFVISHSRSFDAAAFRYRLVLADGAVVESNLPPLRVP